MADVIFEHSVVIVTWAVNGLCKTYYLHLGTSGARLVGTDLVGYARG